MNEYFKLRPGTPDDDNRDYLPPKLYHSDIVVNEGGNNSQPYPERLREFNEELVPGVPGNWFEYVPSTYDGSEKVPLVVSLHGGMMNGWAQCVYTSWSYVAEREGFIVVYPTGTTPKHPVNHFWTMEPVPGSPFNELGEIDGVPTPRAVPIDENNDIKFIFAVIEKMKEKYNIDSDRIFMQGMSNGCGMTMQIARNFDHVLAGAAFSAGGGRIGRYIDENNRLQDKGGPKSVWISHPELNGMGPSIEYEAEGVRQDRLYWLIVNGCTKLPKIKIDGEHNMAFFRGEKADVVFDDIKNRDHGQTLDEACVYWDYLFSGTRRAGDVIEQKEAILPHDDECAAAFAEGVKKVWYKNEVRELPAAPVRWQKWKYHGLQGGVAVRGEYLCVPVRFLAEMAGAEFHTDPDGLACELTLPDGTVVRFARGSILAQIGDRLRSMYCEALHREGELLISVEWFSKYILKQYVSECNGVVYVTDHMADLSYCMADLIKDILTDRLYRGEEYLREIRESNIHW